MALETGSVKNLVVFGDSYSDVGNFNRWTNGPVWSEDVAVGWNASLHSFAYSGAACDNALFPNISAEEQMPSLRDQLEMFYSLQMDLDPAETVYAIWVGTNDIQKAHDQVHGEATPDVSSVAYCINEQVRNLRKIFGAQRIMVFNVPPLERMPFFANHERVMEWAAAAHELNTLLQRDVIQLNKHHRGLQLDLMDIHSLLNDVVENPTLFGFENATLAYLDACRNGACKSAMDQYVWWDRTHLTGGAHRVIANSVLLAGSYVPSTSLDTPYIDVEALLEKPDSQYRSPVYISPPNTGLLDDLVHAWETATVTPLFAPALEVDAGFQWSAAFSLVATLLFLCVIVLIWLRRRHDNQQKRMRIGLLGNEQKRRRTFSPFLNKSAPLIHITSSDPMHEVSR
ncbi:GDSL-like Lipase/Acylhydrolase-domain-containing protein [Syncephalastrum racemosum]|uniref:GDSL-like Lipase/Acylhydrolase-domain-containing protein n=1 Tax=Syncephalastrum racemosum TaxID=13706 RepID=A0A1X2HP27_SYNRA|nr:GDSL-like Lipase/Acylhydrolase-domain-containing protein [Syncephalastrum racemosum]